MDYTKAFESMGLLPKPPVTSFTVTGDRIEYVSGCPVFVGDLVVEVANLSKNGKQSWKAISEGIAYGIKDKSTMRDYWTAVFDICVQHVSPYLSALIAMSIAKSFLTGWSTFHNIVADTFQVCKQYVESGTLSPKIARGVSLNVNLSITDDGTLRSVYSSDNPLAVIGFHLLKMKEIGAHPKKCQMCGRWFFPAARSDEIYCKNEYKNGRNCSEIAFEIKSKDDPFYSEYRKAYKTMSARYARMDTEKKSETLKKWRLNANAQREAYKASGDLEGFKRWIEESKK